MEFGEPTAQFRPARWRWRSPSIKITRSNASTLANQSFRCRAPTEPAAAPSLDGRGRRGPSAFNAVEALGQPSTRPAIVICHASDGDWCEVTDLSTKAWARAVFGHPGGARDDRGRRADDSRARKEEGLHVLFAPLADGRAQAEDLQAAQEALSTSTH